MSARMLVGRELACVGSHWRLVEMSSRPEVLEEMRSTRRENRPARTAYVTVWSHPKLPIPAKPPGRNGIMPPRIPE